MATEAEGGAESPVPAVLESRLEVADGNHEILTPVTKALPRAKLVAVTQDLNCHGSLGYWLGATTFPLASSELIIGCWT